MGAEVVRGYLSVLFPLLLLLSLLTASSADPVAAPPSNPVDRYAHVLAVAPPAHPLPDSVQTAAPKDSVLFGTLAEGAIYRRIRTVDGATLHALTIDTRRGLRVEAVKAGGSYTGLETLGELYERAEREARLDGDTVLAAINAGPWHSQRLSPVGPLVVDGNVIELAADDVFSSLLIYEEGPAAIVRDRMSAQLFWKHRRVDIRSVNRRTNDDVVTLYTPLYGNFVPGAALRSDSAVVADALAAIESVDDGIDGDEEEIDTNEILRAHRFERHRDERERHARKLAVRRLPTARRDWLGNPRLNDTMWTVITMNDTGVVPVPRDGYVISLGTSQESFMTAKPGDTVKLIFQIARNGVGTIHDVVPGYPQLLFRGAATSEPDAAQGPAAAVRPDDRTARTAFGVSEGGDSLLLVAVEAPGPQGRGGMTLEALARYLRSLGAFDAVALQGRSASTMVVNYEAVTHPEGSAPQQKISNGLVVKKKRRW